MFMREYNLLLSLFYGPVPAYSHHGPRDQRSLSSRYRLAPQPLTTQHSEGSQYASSSNWTPSTTASRSGYDSTANGMRSNIASHDSRFTAETDYNDYCDPKPIGLQQSPQNVLGSHSHPPQPIRKKSWQYLIILDTYSWPRITRHFSLGSGTFPSPSISYRGDPTQHRRVPNTLDSHSSAPAAPSHLELPRPCLTSRNVIIGMARVLVALTGKKVPHRTVLTLSR
ncbi:hypothetical protein Pst134EB_019956 [Puccinia striiformis f. sp. tritici]|nr:hypothetical protein Pst134EB_019956 [Puccinia striiformis f. sp. tritici]